MGDVVGGGDIVVAVQEFLDFESIVKVGEVFDQRCRKFLRCGKVGWVPEVVAHPVEVYNNFVPDDEQSASFGREENCNMQWVMKKGPELLTYRAETIVLDLIKVKHPHEVLNQVSAREPDLIG